MEVLERALADLPESADDGARAGLFSNLSRAYMRSGRPEASIETADRALVLAERHHLDRIIAETFNNKGSSLGYLGRNREAVALLRAAVELAHAQGYVTAEIRAMSNLAASTVDDPRRARDTAASAEELARRVGNRSMATWAGLTRLYGSYVLAQDWDESLAGEERHLADMLAQKVASPLDEIRSLSFRGLMHVTRGDDVDGMIDRLEVLAPQTSDSYGPAAVHILRGLQAMLTGDFEAADRELVLASDEPNVGVIFLGLAVRSALWDRNVVRARERADRLDEQRAASSSEIERIAARAGIAALEGRRDDAVAGYRDALDRYRAIGQDLDLAFTGLDFVLTVGADHPASRSAAEMSRVIFERIRARPYLERLDAALAATLPPSGRSSRSSDTAASVVSDYVNRPAGVRGSDRI